MSRALSVGKPTFKTPHHDTSPAQCAELPYETSINSEKSTTSPNKYSTTYLENGSADNTYQTNNLTNIKKRATRAMRMHYKQTKHDSRKKQKSPDLNPLKSIDIKIKYQIIQPCRFLKFKHHFSQTGPDGTGGTGSGPGRERYTHHKFINHFSHPGRKYDVTPFSGIDLIGREHDVQRRVSTSHDVFFGNRVRGGQLG